MDYFIRGYFKSVGGVAEEPGSMAILLNIFAPISLFYLAKVKYYKKFSILFFLYIISLLFLTSSAGIILPIIGVLTSYFVNVALTGKINITFLRVFFGVFLSFFILFIVNYDYISIVLDDMINKFTLNDKSLSASIRTKNWIIGLHQWVKSPLLGQGPGYGVELVGMGYASVFLTILSDLGIFSFLFFILFLMSILKKILALEKYHRFVFLTIFICTTLHFSFIGDFYHAPFWIFLVLTQKVYSKKQRIN